MLPWASEVIECGVFIWLGSDPRAPPTDLMNRPFLSYFTTRELTYPSETKMFPCASQVTSVGRPKRYFSGGAGGSVLSNAPATGSGRRPSTIITRPSGLNLMTMFVPSSTTQMLSCASTRTWCANSMPYAPWPISRT